MGRWGRYEGRREENMQEITNPQEASAGVRTVGQKREEPSVFLAKWAMASGERNSVR